MGIRGIAWKFGDHIHADQACQFYKHKDILLDDREALAAICMTGYDPAFPKKAVRGDFIIAGRNFGWGQLHSHFYASVRALGVGAIIVESINDRSYREAVNSGIRVVLCPCTEAIQTGEPVELDWECGRIIRLTKGEAIPVETASPAIDEVVSQGGIDQYLRERLEMDPAS